MINNWTFVVSKVLLQMSVFLRYYYIFENQPNCHGNSHGRYVGYLRIEFEYLNEREKRFEIRTDYPSKRIAVDYDDNYLYGIPKEDEAVIVNSNLKS